jgi:hypothetical protein
MMMSRLLISKLIFLVAISLKNNESLPAKLAGGSLNTTEFRALHLSGGPCEAVLERLWYKPAMSGRSRSR